jgi:glucuronate isomerase
MKTFMNEDFLLQTEVAKTLYHQYAKAMPIIDYHSHLSAKEIADDIQFSCLGEAWLSGDHYKWRGMRANGVDERFITGDASFKEKFLKYSETVPQTLRNPLYHWTHLELQRYFGITELLSPKTAINIYEQTQTQLQNKSHSARSLLKKMNVVLLCTTDDPIDDLHDHQKIAQSDAEVVVLPTFRAEKAVNIQRGQSYIDYVKTLSEVTSSTISSYADFVKAMEDRLKYFHENGCRLSDMSLDNMAADDYTTEEIEAIFKKAIAGQELSTEEVRQYQSCLLFDIAVMNHDHDWAQQFHLGALRNNNSRLNEQVGADSGVDSIGDFVQAPSLSKFLRRLDHQGKLCKTIIYNLNPSDNEVFATMAGNFQQGPGAGKVQFGASWWFLDQKDGIKDQLDTLSRQGLLSHFIGMLTDSRSLLSYPRHEYFRRILCNVIGTDVENGELPWDEATLGKLIQNICYNNARQYFGFDELLPSTHQ